MENRTTQLTQIRPILDLVIASTEIEKFQNNTLRPILKFQNPIVLQLFQNYINKRFRKKKNTFAGMDISDQNIFINKTMKTDVRLKNILLGIVIGQFTLEELAFYHMNESEINRRITTLLIQRLQSQIEELK